MVGHETKVASLAAGATRGVTKAGRNIIPVRWESGRIPGGQIARASSLFQSLLWILDHVRTNGKQGKAVLNYSGGEWPFIPLPSMLSLNGRTDTSMCLPT